MKEKRHHPKEKEKLHPRSKHRSRYNFKEFCAVYPALIPFVKVNKFGDESVDFFNPAAVKALNTALLNFHYGIKSWDIPKGYLCPPVPGRADYIHNIADLLCEGFEEKIPKGQKIRGLDIGVGANCIYPIIGAAEYNWSFVGADIDEVAIQSAQKTVDSNEVLKGKIELRLQKHRKQIFTGIILKNERFDFTICNPPFHASAAEAEAGTKRKLQNLKQKKINKPTLNFSGQNNELWCDGGEERFVREMVFQSQEFASSVRWFTTLVSKESNLAKIYKALKSIETLDVKTIPMGQGNKVSRIVAWTFMK